MSVSTLELCMCGVRAQLSVYVNASVCVYVIIGRMEHHTTCGEHEHVRSKYSNIDCFSSFDSRGRAGILRRKTGETITFYYER